MISASKEFKEKLKKGANLVNYADFTLSDGTVLNLTYKDFRIGGCSIEDKTTDGKFGVGFVVGKTLNIKIDNTDERFSEYDFYNSIIYVYVAMLLDNGTIEKIRKGVYYATVPSTTGEVIEINAVDGMFLLDKDYSSSKTMYPATLQTILSDACLDCGIPIGFRKFDNMNYVVSEKPESGTYRQIFSYACQIAGYNARIDNNGYMQLVWYDSDLLDFYNYIGGDFRKYIHDTIVDGGNFKDYSKNLIISGGEFSDKIPEHIFRIKSLDLHTDDVRITGVKVVGKDENEGFFGEEGYLIELNNPFSSGKEQVVADYLGRRMVGIAFRPFSAQVLNNPLYEPFEVVRISDKKGNVYLSIINSVSYTIGNYTKISCEAEDPVRNGSVYASPAAQAVVEARRNMEKQLSSYDKAVQNMTQIAGNALGYHPTYETQPDGSIITYLHDKPTLEESKIIYKQSIDGFFVSTDGGESYTAGFDKDGNAVVNILYAIGIVADWIHSGTLTLGGSDNTNGVLNVLNADGALIGRWDKDGIYTTEGSFTGTVNATTLNTANANITGGHFLVETGDTGGNYFRIKNKTGSGTEISLSEITITLIDNKLRLSSFGIEIYSGGFSPVNSFFNISKIVSVIESNSIFLGDLTSSQIHVKGKTIEINSQSGTTISGDISVGGKLTVNNLNVYGTKSRIAKTNNYGEVSQYCYEMPKPYFGDVGEAVLDEDGICYIFLDDIFSETVNTNCQYQVFLQKYGQGDIWVEERNQNYFLIKGTQHLRFGWELKARQLGYETERLEKFVQEEKEQKIDYGKEAQDYISKYYKEMLDNEESN